MEKLFKQIGICIIILLTVMVLRDLNISTVNRFLEIGSQQISRDYTLDDMMVFGARAVETVRGAQAVMVSGVAPSREIRFGEPIDVMASGPVSQVFAVSGGTVIAVGENEERGKYIRIAHGREAESVYGNCKVIFVRPLERVRKGQVIAEFDNDNERDFYHTLLHLR
ncbi:MAG: M23 family metallopeptidase [Clostridiales bacterium]|nr:M23 family metallopeptidase [Clostridiales bacterium]